MSDDEMPTGGPGYELVLARLRALRTPMRHGFADEALDRATRAAPGQERPLARRGAFVAVLGDLVRRWETWIGVAAGATAALLVVAIAPFGPGVAPSSEPAGVLLQLNESREIALIIDSERDLEDATISIVVTGGVELAGLSDGHWLRWQTRLEHGANLLSLPVVGRATGPGELIAIIEHGGRSRRVSVALLVREDAIHSTAVETFLPWRRLNAEA